jgi:hypothetical protein
MFLTFYDGVNLFGTPGHRSGGSCFQLKFQVYKLSLPCVTDQLVDDQAVLLLQFTPFTCKCVRRLGCIVTASVAGPAGPGGDARD